MTEELTFKLRAFVSDNGIKPDPDFKIYQSGVHAVVDCVFSSQTRFGTVENVLQRLSEQLPDEPGLTFSEFMKAVDQQGAQSYAQVVLKNQQQIAGHLKVQVAYDVAQYFVRHGFETKAQFQQTGAPDSEEYVQQKTRVEQLILVDLVAAVHGIGPVLARYLLLLLGDESAVKPDTIITRLFTRLAQEQFEIGNKADMQRIEQAITAVAREKGVTPARLDNALWRFETGRTDAASPRAT